MQGVSSYQIIGVAIAIFFAMLMKLMAEYTPKAGEQQKKKLSLFIFLWHLVMSVGAGFFTFIGIVETDLKDYAKVLLVGIGSFLGSAIVEGLNSLKGSFFKKVWQNLILGLANKIVNNDDTKSDTEGHEDEP